MLQATAQTPERPPLVQFDDAVAQGRRVMREYCAVTQEMIAASQGDTTQQQADALMALRQTKARWSAIQKQYATRPPAEYARDKDFAGRLQDIADAMEDMERALAGGEARRSFRSCGYACGLFVAMHEDNGLEYPLDKLFHLRKELKSAQALLAAKGVNAVRGRIASLLAKRDAVLATRTHSVPGGPGPTEYEHAVRELSRALDELALAAASEDTSRVEKSLAESSQLANKAYGLAL
jgi:hypothetical protein